jgi:hypothetical protein
MRSKVFERFSDGTHFARSKTIRNDSSLPRLPIVTAAEAARFRRASLRAQWRVEGFKLLLT